MFINASQNWVTSCDIPTIHACILLVFFVVVCGLFFLTCNLRMHVNTKKSHRFLKTLRMYETSRCEQWCNI